MDKKELKQEYKQLKPEMGVYAYKCKSTGKMYLGYGQNIKGDINSITFQLNLGNFYSNAKSGLQEDWKKFGASGFEISVLEILEYSQEASKTDYQADLRALRDCCSERFSQFEFIQK